MILIDPNEPFHYVIQYQQLMFCTFHKNTISIDQFIMLTVLKIIQFHKNLLQTGETNGDFNSLNSSLFHV